MTPGVRIRAQDWSWTFVGRPRPAVSRVTFEIAPGERILLSGPSGSGKSTLLSALAGVLGSDQGRGSGELLIDGAQPHPGRQLSGLVLQDPEGQMIMERVGDDVAFGCENFGIARDDTWRRVDQALSAVGLDVDLSSATATLSGGQKQRLALAGVIALRPGLLLLDEPTSNLDPEGVADIVTAVSDYAHAAGCTLVVVDHNPGPWTSLVNRVMVLDAEGQLSGARNAHPTPRRTLSRRQRAAGGTIVSTHDLLVGHAGQHDIATPDLNLRSGTITAVTGPNGIGKSTLALTLGGLLAPRSGEMRVTGFVASSASASSATNRRLRYPATPHRWPARELVRRVGSVFQSPENQFVRSTAQSEVALGLRITGARSTNVDRLTRVALERMGLGDLSTAHPFTLSGGEKRRLAVAAATVTRPRLVVVDEPTFGQDDDSWREVVDLLDELAAAGSAVVITTHDSDLLALVDEVVDFPKPGQS